VAWKASSLGNDALKAHAILVKTAERFGGVVYPPVYFHEGFGPKIMVPVLAELFERLKKSGFRVIMGVSGHNVMGQIDMINEALKPVLADGTAAGVGLWEITLSQGNESNTDHAAKWETSNMLFLYPDLVDMGELGTEPLALDMKPRTGSADWIPGRTLRGSRPAEHRTGRGSHRQESHATARIAPGRPTIVRFEKHHTGNWWSI